MRHKLFETTDRTYTIMLPEDWDQYDSEEPGTYAFFNSHSQVWKGNLRITMMQFKHRSDPDKNKAVEYIKSEATENEYAEIIKLGEWNACRYRKNVIQDNESFVMYYWVIGEANTLFTCSFTIAKRQDGTKENEDELNVVENILQSIRLNGSTK